MKVNKRLHVDDLLVSSTFFLSLSHTHVHTRVTIAYSPQDNEFHGVMRFYFQDAGQKVATKCVRVSSTATATDVIKTLIEKFRPDIRMLSIPEYALYEIHENEGESSDVIPLTHILKHSY